MVDLISTGGQQLSGVGANPGAGEAAGIGGGGGGGLSDLLSNNPNLLGALGGAAGGALGGLLGGNNNVPYTDQLTGVAQRGGAISNDLFTRGTALMDPLSSGKLPAGAEQSVQNMIQNQTTTLKGRYAALGQTGSTMESDALSNLQNQAEAQRFQIAQQMEQAGLQATGQSLTALGIQNQAYGSLMQAQMKQDSSMNSAIGSFASALGGAAAKAAPLLLA